MGLVANNKVNYSGWRRVPNGAHIGRCFSVIDLGTQTTQNEYGTKKRHKIKIIWELFGEDENGLPLTVDFDGKEMPMTISKDYTVSLNEKANLRHDLASWRGRDFTDEEALAFDVSNLIGAYCLVNVTTTEKNGKTYSNISGLTPLPSAFKANKPLPVHKNIIFDLDKPDMDIFNNFHEKLKEKIMSSPEFKKINSGQFKSDEVTQNIESLDDDIPY